jgi:hypothetical protein
VIECATLATLTYGHNGAWSATSFDPPAGEIAVMPAFIDVSAGANEVVVATRDSIGTLEDHAFWLALNC